MTSSVDAGRAVDDAYLYFSKAVETVSYDKPMKYRLDKWTVRWTENWLNC